MNMHLLRTAAFIAALCICLSAAACSAPGGVPDTGNHAILHEPEFGGIYIGVKIPEFSAMGFSFGDSVDVMFSNGYKLEDLPYYNGYYVKAGESLLVGYPGYDYIKAAINNGDDLWEIAGLDDSCTASIKLNKRSKYADIQEARDIHYSDDRSKYKSDEVFANFRSINVSGIREGVLFRSASPCDNQHNRAPYVDALIKAAQVRCILNLADTPEKAEGYINADGFNSPYFLSLYNGDNVVFLALNMNYSSAEFKEKVADGFRKMAESEGSYLVHCTEGKDRTGFVCMLLEALAGADYDEIAGDYMITYDNYYGITKENDKPKYDIILDANLNDMIKAVVGDDSVDITSAELAPYAKNYIRDGGMTDAEIDLLISRITAEP